MSAARDGILSAVRRALGSPQKSPEAIAAEAVDLVADPAQVQPKFASQTLLERFIEKVTSERVTATVEKTAAIAEVPSAVARYLSKNGLGPKVALPPSPNLTTLSWNEIVTHHDLAPDEACVVSQADYAIAETGSVVFLSRPDSPTLYTFLPLHHIVIIEVARILPYLEDFWIAFDRNGQAQPRNINIVTGTSGTADIEAKNIRGAHGPRYMHILIVGQG